MNSDPISTSDMAPSLLTFTTYHPFNTLPPPPRPAGQSTLPEITSPAFSDRKEAEVTVSPALWLQGMCSLRLYEWSYAISLHTVVMINHFTCQIVFILRE